CREARLESNRGAARDEVGTPVPRGTPANQSFRNTGFCRAVKVEVFSKLLLIGALHFSAGFGKNTKLLTLTSRASKNQEHLVVRLTHAGIRCLLMSRGISEFCGRGDKER